MAGTEEETITPPIKIAFEESNAGPCKVQVKTVVPKEVVEKEFERAVQFINNNVDVPGFRLGKVPPDIVMKRFLKYVQERVRTNVMTLAADEFADQNSWRVLSPADVKEEPTPEKGNAYRFMFEVEIRPEIKLKNYKGITLKKPESETKEKIVESILARYKQARAYYQPVEEASKAGDLLIIDCTMQIGDTSESSENVEMEAGKQFYVYDVHVKEITDWLVGKKAGESLEHKFTFPETTRELRLAKKDAAVNLKIKSVKRLQEPELNDDLAKEFGYQNLDELKKRAEDAAASEESRIRERHLEEAVRKLILDEYDFTVPEFPMRENAQVLSLNMMEDFINAGIDANTIAALLDQQKGKILEMAKLETKVNLVMDEIARREKTYVTEDEVDKFIGETAQKRGQPAYMVRAYFEGNDMLPGIRKHLKYRQVLKLIVDNAKVE